MHAPSPTPGRDNPVNPTPQTAAAATAGAKKKRKIESSLTIEADGRIAASCLDVDGEQHVLIESVHSTCHAITHRRLEPTQLLLAPQQKKQKKQHDDEEE